MTKLKLKNGKGKSNIVKPNVSRSKPAVRLGIRDIDKMIAELNFAPVLKAQARQVKWLYNNSNKCTMVYDEKLVRIIVHRLQKRIEELEEGSKIKFPLPTSVRDKW